MNNQWHMGVPGIIDAYCGNDEEVVVPAELDGITATALTGGVFNAMPIRILTIPDGVDIASANGLCMCCVALEKVTVGNGATSIPANGFFGCSNLNSFSCSSQYSGIGENAFYACTSLAEFDLPASVSNLDTSCFICNSSLASIRFHGDAPSCGTNVFYETHAFGYYPAGNQTYSNPWNGLAMTGN